MAERNLFNYQDEKKQDSDKHEWQQGILNIKKDAKTMRKWHYFLIKNLSCLSCSYDSLQNIKDYLFRGAYAIEMKKEFIVVDSR